MANLPNLKKLRCRLMILIHFTGSGWTLTNLRLLSREFKNAISHRIVASLREMAGVCRTSWKRHGEINA